LKRLLFFAIVFFAFETQAYHQFFDPTTSIPIDVYTPYCKTYWGWGRSTVVIETDYGRSECTFSHTERRPADLTSFYYALFIQHFNCTDGTNAQFSANWLGEKPHFLFFQTAEKSIRCD
jgi:hypothetical protein